MGDTTGRPVRFVAVADTGSIGDAEPAAEFSSVGDAEPGPDHACTLSGSERCAHHHAEPRAHRAPIAFPFAASYERRCLRLTSAVAIADSGSIGDAEPAAEFSPIGDAEPGPDHACTLSGSERRAHHHAEPRAVCRAIALTDACSINRAEPASAEFGSLSCADIGCPDEGTDGRSDRCAAVVCRSLVRSSQT